MKVYVEPHADISRGVKRVAQALRRHVPAGVACVETPAEADLVVHHVIGVRNLHARLDLDALIAEQGKPYALVQYCLRTTENGGDPGFWGPLWRGARGVWSYYDLARHLGDDLPSFYYAPLGVDTRVFRPSAPLRKLFVIGTSGYVAASESVEECHQAMRAARGDTARQFHLGPPLPELGGTGVLVTYLSNAPDALVADFWSQCTYVSGLRRVEGFELPALEALACGSRPVLFDAPHYRHWFGGHAEYVAEGEPETVMADLRALFECPVRPVLATERAAVAAAFDWAVLAGEFWRRVL